MTSRDRLGKVLEDIGHILIGVGLASGIVILIIVKGSDISDAFALFLILQIPGVSVRFLGHALRGKKDRP